ncbi:TetR/AcrR family transcriptional regulator [Nocardioides marmoriginsengisoli]|uniref:TetR/AcrR family transcriptional regulator n=1 Tax=Nocardioides marmoriginsengisoli TaxID=661483 RepID=A0A3N0CGV2_9ACTN|nr:TetR family transcriptional regulator [Nocardioides marmoriginsengisoli]RNL62256.1 TetR/AcrR family transcriptional regulator [Nocardioides marmoriginsengisoli]
MTTSRGRRPGSPDTRAAILESARTLFAARGFAATSLRSIASAAGVDPALVHHYFGGKDDLFVAALSLPIDPRAVFAQFAAGEVEDAGERLVRGFLSVWDDPELQPSMVGFARGLIEPSATEMIRHGFLRVVIWPLGDALGIDEPGRRMPLVASQMIGLVMLRYLIAVEPLASMPPDDVVAIYAPTIQRYLTGDLPPLP